MPPFSTLLITLIVLFAAPSLHAGTAKQPAATTPGVEPLPFQEATMTEDQMVAFFESQKKGTPMQLTLTRGQVIKCLFSSYDDYYETVWVVPKGEKGLFNEKGYKLAGVKNAQLWDKKATPSAEPPAPAELGKDEYYLLNSEGIK